MQLSTILTIVSTLLAAQISAAPTELGTIEVGNTTYVGEIGIKSRGWGDWKNWKSPCAECTPGKGQCYGVDLGCYQCDGGRNVCQRAQSICRCPH